MLFAILTTSSQASGSSSAAISSLKAHTELRAVINKIMFVIETFFAVVFSVFGNSYAAMFGCSDVVANMVASGFRIYAATFLVMGFDMINSMYFYSCGDALSSAIISSLRGVVLLLALTFIFPALWGMTGVWFVAPATEILTAVVSLFLINKQAYSMKNAHFQ